MDWRRLCIDSRFRTKDSLSNSDFYVDLPYPTSVPRGSVMYVDGVCMSYTLPTVIEGVNDHLYVQERVTGHASDYMRTVVLDAGQYNAETLKDEVVAKLNAGKHVSGTYSGTVESGKLTLSNDTPLANGKCYVYTRSANDLLYLKLLFPTYAGADACELIGHWDNPVLADGTSWIFASQSWTAQYMDLMHHKQVFIHAPGLGESTTMNLVGNTDIIRRVLLGGSAQGDVVNDVLQTTMSGVMFGSDTVLQRIHFQIKGYDGTLIEMGNHQISWELILQRPGD